MTTKIQRALISVSDKTGVLAFAQALAGFGVEILSTGGTAKLLADNGVKVIEVANVINRKPIPVPIPGIVEKINEGWDA